MPLSSPSPSPPSPPPPPRQPATGIPAATALLRRPISRSRTGCHPCRRRRLKCDEQKPACRACTRRELQCDYGPRFVFRDDTAFIAKRAVRIEEAKLATIREQSSLPRRSRKGGPEDLSDHRHASASSSGSRLAMPGPAPATARRGGTYLGPNRDQSREENDSDDADATRVDNGSQHVADYYMPDHVSQGGTTPDAPADDYSNDLEAMQETFDQPATPVCMSRDTGPNTTDLDALAQAATAFNSLDIDAYSNHLQLVGHSITSGTTASNVGVFNPPTITYSNSPGFSAPNTLEAGARQHIPGADGYSASPDWGLEFWGIDTNLASGYHGHPNGSARAHISSEGSIRDLLDDPARQARHLPYWRREIRPRLPAVFADIEGLIRENEVVRLAVLSLAASRLTSPPPTLETPSGDGSVSTPGSAICEGAAYYSRALTGLATKGLSGVFKMELCTRLVVLLLFAYFELVSGTVHGCIAHIQKFDELVCSEYDSIVRSSLGVRLILAWTGLRAQLVADCVPYDTPRNFPSVFAGSPIQREIERYIELSDSTYAFLATRLSIAHRTSDLLLLLRIIGSDVTSPLYRAWTLSFARISRDCPPERLTEQSPTDLMAALEIQKRLLDKWHEKLPLADLPIESFSSNELEGMQLQLPGLHVRPLRFNTHRAAMDYIRYACAQLFASKSSIEYCSNSRDRMDAASHGRSRDPTPINAWVLLILRILAGLDIDACLVDNTFEIGAVWVVSRVALRCCSLDVLTWLDRWLHKVETLGGYQEGCLPVRIVRRAVSKMTVEWQKGRVVNLIHTSLDHMEEKQELCRTSFENARFRAIILGFNFGLNGPENSSAINPGVVPFVDVIGSD